MGCTVMSSVVQGETTGACLILNLHRIEKKIKDRDLVTVTFSLFTTVLSQWDFSHGKFWLLSPGKASCDRAALPNLQCMLGVLLFP